MQLMFAHCLEPCIAEEKHRASPCGSVQADVASYACSLTFRPRVTSNSWPECQALKRGHLN